MFRKIRCDLHSLVANHRSATQKDANDYVTHYFRPHLARAGQKPTLNIQDLGAVHGESLTEAYVFQDLCIEKIEELNDPLVGWRVQGISDASRRRLISRELYCGPIMNSMTKNLQLHKKALSQGIPSMKRDKLLDLEVQLAFQVEDGDIPDIVSSTEIADYLGAMYLVVELTACRMPWRPRDVPTHITDFSGGGYVILSDPIPKQTWISKDLANQAAVIMRNSSPVGIGKTSKITGTPLSAIKYLHKHLKTRGRDLQDKIVCTGCMGAVSLEPGHYTAMFGTLGSVDSIVEP
ncbi:fumarylacetoacetate (FAA) hydrolase [Perkinsela sp. CCAP 1560/4]|nr:fumarylacetoacetate (FAA) hydrolase [Perkinsela sp. CCAP 1560/4]|eukprot:KNH04165.1 fumarylacetoacetate (FAA) hydrolase [Perkinsela sp. CCAP 1560/4]